MKTPDALTAGDLELRPATLDDAAVAADIDTEAHPDDVEDPKMVRHWWSMTASDKGHRSARLMALRDGRPVGSARWDHPLWEKMPERFIRITAELRPALRTAARLGALYETLEQQSRTEDARTATTWAWEYDALRIEMLVGRGYRETRRERFWELDLAEGRERIAKMAEESRERMRKEGITVLTFDRETDPNRWKKLKRMSDEAELDVPTTVPHVLVDMDEWMKWFDSPAIRQDRMWIAREGDDIVGISQLAYPPVRGVVVTDWTGTARNVRGRGVARALKCETLMQAIALGVDRVRTDNDSTNTPILHINETMGYRRRPDMVQYRKEL